MARLNWFQTTIHEARTSVGDITEDIARFSQRLDDELRKPSKFEIGAYSSRTSGLASFYGCLGTNKILLGDESGWSDIATSVANKCLSLAARIATRFANPSAVDTQLAGDTFVHAIAMNNRSLQDFCRGTIQGANDVDLPNEWTLTPFHEFLPVFASPPEQWGRLSAENPFAPLLRAESPEQFAAALVDYDQARGKLVEQDPDGFSPFDGFPIALFPAEVIAIADVRGWRDQIVALEAPEFMASPLAQPPAEIACPTDPLLDAIADRIVQLGGIRIPWN